MTAPHIPLGPELPNGAHYERLSRTTLRLDGSLGPHVRRRRSRWPQHIDWGFVLVLLAVALVIGLGWRPPW